MRKNNSRSMLLTLKQASELSGIPYMSLREMVLRGDLPRVDLGTRKFWIRRADLERRISDGITTGGLQ